MKFTKNELTQELKNQKWLEENSGDWVLIDNSNIEHWVSAVSGKSRCNKKYTSYRHSNYTKSEKPKYPIKICKQCFDTFDKESQKIILEGDIIKTVDTRKQQNSLKVGN